MTIGRVIRSTGEINDKHVKQREAEQALRDSWDYWERRGYPHPEKVHTRGIKPLEIKGNEE